MVRNHGTVPMSAMGVALGIHDNLINFNFDAPFIGGTNLILWSKHQFPQAPPSVMHLKDILAIHGMLNIVLAVPHAKETPIYSNPIVGMEKGYNPGEFRLA
ncbi:hypothetical protein VP01_2015g3 [Puccinia sorghi]|uniref:Uncharacterized protein n=1 Tax=Puccinia sorghi TaxID=27349 RepID=A0A0L6VBT7_9BASI|nr:hypothetical protein VP01_2015g3 [Puccinia sorghi]